MDDVKQEMIQIASLMASKVVVCLNQYTDPGYTC